VAALPVQSLMASSWLYVSQSGEFTAKPEITRLGSTLRTQPYCQSTAQNDTRLGECVGDWALIKDYQSESAEGATRAAENEQHAGGRKIFLQL